MWSLRGNSWDIGKSAPTSTRSSGSYSGSSSSLNLPSPLSSVVSVVPLEGTGGPGSGEEDGWFTGFGWASCWGSSWATDDFESDCDSGGGVTLFCQSYCQSQIILLFPTTYWDLRNATMLILTLLFFSKAPMLTTAFFFFVLLPKPDMPIAANTSMSAMSCAID